MLRFQRSRATAEGVGPAGQPYTLTTEQFSVRLAVGRAGLGATYAHPRWVTHNGVTTSVFDLVFLVRLIALLAMTLAAIVGTLRR